MGCPIQPLPDLSAAAPIAARHDRRDLANSGVTNVDQLQFISPGATVNNFGQGIDFNIRGIGKAEHNTQTTTGVITYRDGVATFPGYFTARAVLRHRARRNSARAAGHVRRPERDRRRRVRHVEQIRSSTAAITATCRARSATTTTSACKARSTCRSATRWRRASHSTATTRDSFYDITGSVHRRRRRSHRQRPSRPALAAEPRTLSVLFKTDLNYLDLSGYPVRSGATRTNDLFEITANADMHGAAIASAARC